MDRLIVFASFYNRYDVYDDPDDWVKKIGAWRDAIISQEELERFLNEIYPDHTFTYSSEPFKPPKFRFKSLVDNPKISSGKYPLVHPNMYHKTFLLCLDVIHTYLDHSETEYSRTVKVNSRVVGKRHNVVTVGEDGLEGSIYLADGDVKKAYHYLKYAGMTRYGSGGVTFSNSALDKLMGNKRKSYMMDFPLERVEKFIFNNPSDYFSVWPADKFIFIDQKYWLVHELEIGSYLAKSNSQVFSATLKDDFGKRKCVVKVLSPYPFKGTDLYRGQFGATEITLGKEEARMYGEDTVYSFHLPYTGFYFLVLPYLGNTITSIPLYKRRELYRQFKTEFSNQFLSTLDRGDDGKYKTRYTDVKPMNTTYDGQHFYLIDVDDEGFTPEFYGPVNHRVVIFGPGLKDVLFAVYVLHIWFITGFQFEAGVSDLDKFKWIDELSDEPKRLFKRLLDRNVSEDDCLNDYKQFVKNVVDLKVKTFGKRIMDFLH